MEKYYSWENQLADEQQQRVALPVQIGSFMIIEQHVSTCSSLERNPK